MTNVNNLPRDFANFLKENGALYQYDANNLHIISYQDIANKPGWVSSAFNWEHSLQDYDYWHTLSNAWRKVCNDTHK